MAQLIDCYWLTDSRNFKKLVVLLDQIMPQRQSSSIDYPVPQFSKTSKKTFNKTEDVMKFLDENKMEPYSIYWENPNKKSSYKNVMLFYTDDAKVIFGLSIEGKEPDENQIIIKYLKIKEILNSKLGCITMEEPPPTNSIKFEMFCKKRLSPK